MAARKPAPDATPKPRRYSAVTEAGFHFPDGFIPLGHNATLTDEQAERGLAAGLLAPTPTNEEN